MTPALMCAVGDMGSSLDIPALQRAYSEGQTTPAEVISGLYPLLAAEEGIFVALAPLASLLDRCR